MLHYAISFLMLHMRQVCISTAKENTLLCILFCLILWMTILSTHKKYSAEVNKQSQVRSMFSLRRGRSKPVLTQSLILAQGECWRRGLLGYLIRFATHAFVPQRQESASELPSHLVFPSISTDFTPTPRVLFTSHSFQLYRFLRELRVEPEDLTQD